MATSFLHIERVEANLPMSVGHLHTSFGDIVLETGWSVRSVHLSKDGMLCLYFA
jgi:hypothetical protein